MTKSFSWKEFAQNQLAPRRIGSEKQGIRLLIVDSDEGFLETIRDYSELCNHEYDIEVKIAKSGKEAMRAMKWDPTVVLLDAFIPDINSFTLLAEFRSKMVPVILTVENRPDDLVSGATENGATAVLFKGAEPEELESLFSKIAEASIPQFSKH